MACLLFAVPISTLVAVGEAIVGAVSFLQLVAKTTSSSNNVNDLLIEFFILIVLGFLVMSGAAFKTK
ncbi:hypothetical protein D3C87_814970 [compost metagenome]